MKTPIKFFSLMLFVIITTSVCLPLKSETLHWNYGRGYSPFRYATPVGIIIDNPSDTLQYDYYVFPNICDEFQLKFRGANLNGNPQKKYTYKTRGRKEVKTDTTHWGFFITSPNDTLIFSLKRGEKTTVVESLPSLVIEIYQLPQKSHKVMELTENVNPYDGDNLWEIQVDNGTLQFSGGSHSLSDLFNTSWNRGVNGFGFFCGWAGKIRVSDISLNFSWKEEIIPSDTDLSFEKLDDYFSQSNDPMEGYWTIFDRELEESLLKPGGAYSLACLKDGEVYKMFYLEGAVVNSKEWKRGDTKLILTPSAFPGVFDVEWIDAMKMPLNHDIKAQRGEGNTLLIQFPYQSSKIRLRKISGD